MSEKPLFEDIKKILIEQNREPSEIEEIEKAYLFAKKLHEGQYRVSEEPYIIHPDNCWCNKLFFYFHPCF